METSQASVLEEQLFFCDLHRMVPENPIDRFSPTSLGIWLRIGSYH